MIFYLSLLVMLLMFSRGKYSALKSFIPHLILSLIVALKGLEVGCDTLSYFHRYQSFNVIKAFEKSTGEFGWYLVEYFTFIYDLDYQTYTITTAIIGFIFLFFAQKKIKYLGFLFFIYQMIVVQLGLSGMRQFIAVCILIYTISIYIYGNQKSIFKFTILIFLAASFHISVLSMFFVLPFIHKLRKGQIILIVIFCIIGLSSDVISSVNEKYDTRYLEGVRVSAGAWIRFAISCVIIFFAVKKAPKKMVNLGLVIICFGIILGIVNTIALHRFNYYFLPIVCLMLIKNYKLGNLTYRRMNYIYALSAFYFLFWFKFSDYSSCVIQYNFFFE